MADKLRIELENATGQGIKSVNDGLDSIADGAKNAGRALDSAAADAKEFSDSFDVDAHMKISHLEGALSDLRRELHASVNEADQLRDEIDDLNDELGRTVGSANKAGKALKGLDPKGKNSGIGGLSLQISGFNQALEIGKKGVEAVTRSVLFLEEAGNPAAKSLVDSFSGIQSALVEIGDDPVLVNTMKTWESTIKETVVPAIGEIPGALRWVQDGFAGIVTNVGEFTGFFPEGTTENLRQEQEALASIADEQREINEEARKTAVIFGRIDDIEAKLADEAELNAISQLKSERQLLDLLDLEIENRQELADVGELSGKKLEASDKRVETIKRRLMAATKEQADAEIKAQEDIGKARADAAEQWTQILADGKAAFDEQTADQTDEATDKAKKVLDALQQVIAQAKSLQNPQNNLVDDLRGQFSDKEVNAQLVKDAKGKAREGVAKKFVGKVDPEGNGIGWTKEEKDRNEREFKAAAAKAEREATIRTNRQIRMGAVTGEDQLAARDSLLMGKADKALESGILSPKQHKAFNQQLEDSRNAFGAQQNEARDMAGLQALGGNIPSKEQWMDAKIRRGNQAGGVTQGTDDRAMGDLLGNVAKGGNANIQFAQTATQGFGQISGQVQQQAGQIQALQQQFIMIMQANQNSAGRARAQRGSR